MLPGIDSACLCLFMFSLFLTVDFPFSALINHLLIGLVPGNLSKLEEEMVNTSIFLPFEVHFFESTMEALYKHVGIYTCSDLEATCLFSR